VYYVKNVRLVFVPFRGYNCLKQAGLPNIIYVSTSMHSTTTLAHEIGHALIGLGHPTDQAGFSEDNLMWQSPSLEDADARSTLTLGQTFRATADEQSWLNWQVGAGKNGTPIRQSGPTLPCQTKASKCPQLRLAW
jgi:hypothetical protein